MNVPPLIPASMRCPRCRLENPPEAMVCDCGYDFRTGTMTGPRGGRSAEPQLAPRQPPGEPVAFCSQCGSRLTEGARFCAVCGAKT